MAINKKEKVLVTGGAGFMGSHLCQQLLDKGYAVYAVDDLSGGFMRNLPKQAKFTKLDLRDRKKTAAYVARLRPTIIFHLAADATEGRSQFTPLSAVDRNLVAYMNLLVPAIKAGLKKMILTSSMSVYGAQQVPFHERMVTKPEDVYGTSKAAMETITRVMGKVHGFAYVIIRPHNVYGPKQNLSDPYRNVIGIFINRLLHDKTFYIYGDGRQKRAFSYVDDVIQAMVNSAFRKKCEGTTMNIGGDHPITLNELAAVVLEEFFGTKDIPARFRPIHVPDRPQEVKYAYSDHTLARKLMDFREKTQFRTGMRRMIEWAKELGPQEFIYLDKLELENESTPKTWKNKLL